jgi:uncharacterized membrane-anchored protein
MKRYIKLYIILAIQILIIISMVASSYLIFLTGERVFLEVEPVDPRSLFRGDYVRLGYNFSQIDLNSVNHKLDSDYPSHIFISFKKTGDYWQPSIISDSIEAINNNHPFLKGKVTSVYDNQIWAEFGIETYFVPEGQGKDIEKKISERKVIAEVYINKKGIARIKQLHFK